MKKLLTDRLLRSLRPPAGPGTRITIWDSVMPGGNIQITATGNISYGFQKRIKGQKNAGRRIVGYAWKVGQPLPIALADLRDMARDMLLEYARGIDPKATALAKREAETAAKRGAFNAVIADYLREHVTKLRSAREITAIFKNDIAPAFGTRQISSITVDEIEKLIKTVAKTRPSQARAVYNHAGGLFAWAIAQRCYGVTASPFAVFPAKDLLGKAPQGDRVLSDAELASVWRATEGLGYPGGSLVRLLVLTGLRRSEAAELSWSEIDLDREIITVPASRLKGGSTFVLPLAPQALAILQSVPGRSGFVFSTTGGKRPVAFFSKLKARLDSLMPEMPGWTFHDLRRSFRTGLAMLGTSEIVSELCIAHAQKSLHRVYDRFGHVDEKRQALAKWERHVLALAAQSEAKVVEFPRK